MKIEHWHYLDTGAHDAPWNMACDEVLLRTGIQNVGRFCEAAINENADSQSRPTLVPLLRVYGWSHPTVSLGYFQKWSPSLSNGLALVRRPTGGGLVEHGDGFTYSVIIPKTHTLAALPTLEIYREIHEAVRKALGEIGTESTLNIQRSTLNAQRNEPIARCFVQPSPYDLFADGRKIAGAAIRKTKDGVLVQGEIKATLGRSGLLAAMTAKFGARFEELTLTNNLKSEINKLAREKYASEAWTKRFV